MAQNTSPVFVKTPHIGWVNTSASAITGTDGTDNNVKTVFTADPVGNGSKIEYVYISATANTSLCNIRFWVNNGSTAGTAANNSEIYEQVVPAITLSTTATNTPVVWPCNLVLPPGYKLQVACTVASCVFAVTAVGGDY